MGHDYPLDEEFLMGHECSQSTFLTFSQHFYGHEMYFVPSPLTFSWVKVRLNGIMKMALKLH